MHVKWQITSRVLGTGYYSTCVPFNILPSKQCVQTVYNCRYYIVAIGYN